MTNPIHTRRRFAAAVLPLTVFTACGPRPPFQVGKVFRARRISCAGTSTSPKNSPAELLLFVELTKLAPSETQYQVEEISLAWDGGKASPGRTAWMSSEDKQTKKLVPMGISMLFSVPNAQRRFTLAVRNYPTVEIIAPEQIDDSRTQC